MSQFKSEEQYDESHFYDEGIDHYMGEILVDGVHYGFQYMLTMMSYWTGGLTRLTEREIINQKIAKEQKSLQDLQKKLQQVKEIRDPKNKQLLELNGQLSHNQNSQTQYQRKHAENRKKYGEIDKKIADAKALPTDLDQKIEVARTAFNGDNALHEENRRKADSLLGRARDLFVRGRNVLARGWNAVVTSIVAGFLSVSVVPLYSELAEESFRKKAGSKRNMDDLEAEKHAAVIQLGIDTEQAESLNEAIDKAIRKEEAQLQALHKAISNGEAQLQALKLAKKELKDKQAAAESVVADLTDNISRLEQSICDKEKNIQDLIETKTSLDKKVMHNLLAEKLKTRRALIQGTSEDDDEDDDSVDSADDALFKPVKATQEEQATQQTASMNEKKVQEPQSAQNKGNTNNSTIFKSLNAERDKEKSNTGAADKSQQENDADSDDDWDDQQTIDKKKSTPQAKSAKGKSIDNADKLQNGAGRSSPTSVLEPFHQNEKLNEIAANQSTIQQQKQKAKSELLARDIMKNGCLLFNFSHENELSQASKESVLLQLGSKVAVVLVGDALYCMSKIKWRNENVLKSEKLSSQQEEQSLGLIALKQQIKDQVGATDLKEISSKESAQTLSDVVFGITGIRNKEASKENVAGAGRAGMEAGQTALQSSDDIRKLKALLQICRLRGLIKTDIMSIDFPTQDEEKEVKDERLKRNGEKPVEDRIAALYDEIRARKNEHFIGKLIDGLTELGYEDKGLTQEKSVRSSPEQVENKADVVKQAMPSNLLASINQQKENRDPNTAVNKRDMKSLFAEIRKNNSTTEQEVDGPKNSKKL